MTGTDGITTPVTRRLVSTVRYINYSGSFVCPGLTSDDVSTEGHVTVPRLGINADVPSIYRGVESHVNLSCHVCIPCINLTTVNICPCPSGTLRFYFKSCDPLASCSPPLNGDTGNFTDYTIVKLVPFTNCVVLRGPSLYGI